MAACTRFVWRAAITVSATTSVRLAVLPPAWKKRRRTRPTTTTSAPMSRVDAEAGAFGHTTLTVSVRSPWRWTETSSSAWSSPDGSTRRAAGRDRRPCSSTTFIALFIALLPLVVLARPPCRSCDRPAQRRRHRGSASGELYRRRVTLSGCPEAVSGRGASPVSTQCGQALGHVDEARVVLEHGAEHVPGPRDVAGPLVEVGQGVEQADMVQARAPCPRYRPLEQADRRGDVALVGQGAGGDDAALRDEVAPGRDLPELVPQVVDGRP